MTQPKKLLPCPFCGEQPVERECEVYCKKCDLMMGYETQELTREFWNTRNTKTTPSVSVEQIQEIINESQKCPNCDDVGYTVEQTREETRVTRDMAIDAGDPSMEGNVYEQADWSQVQCQFCYENSLSRFNLAKRLHDFLNKKEG